MKTFIDSQSQVYAGSNSATSLPITINGEFLDVITNGRSAVAAELVNGVNKLLWKDQSGNLMGMNFNSVWQFISSEEIAGLSTNSFYNYELNFDIDADSDGQIGDPDNKENNTISKAQIRTVTE